MKYVDYKYEQLLADKLGMLEQMYDNTVQQHHAIDERSEDKLLNLIAQREQIIDKIDQLNQIINELYEKSLYNNKLRQIEESIQSKLQQVYELDEQNRLKMQQFKSDLEHSIKHITVGKKALSNGYFKPHTQINGYYFDQKIGK